MTTKPLADVTPTDLVESLRSDLCPACGGLKQKRQTLCFRDYSKLNFGQKIALYDGVGAGYEQAVDAAFKALGRKSLYLPEFASNAA